MSLTELLRQIESEDFAARVNIASSRNVFISALSEDPAVKALIQILRDNPKGAEKILVEIKMLAELQVDYRYENPYDAALAAYAWVLASGARELAPIAAEIVLSARQIWWAREIASLIFETLPASPGFAETENVVALVSEVSPTEVFLLSTHVSHLVVHSSLLINIQFLAVTKPPRLLVIPPTDQGYGYFHQGKSIQPLFDFASTAKAVDRTTVDNWSR